MFFYITSSLINMRNFGLHVLIYEKAFNLFQKSLKPKWTATLKNITQSNPNYVYIERHNCIIVRNWSVAQFP